MKKFRYVGIDIDAGKPMEVKVSSKNRMDERVKVLESFTGLVGCRDLFVEAKNGTVNKRELVCKLFCMAVRQEPETQRQERGQLYWKLSACK